jgi:hypothetical protein
MHDAMIDIAFVAARYGIPDRNCDRRLMILPETMNTPSPV